MKPVQVREGNMILMESAVSKLVVDWHLNIENLQMMRNRMFRQICDRISGVVNEQLYQQTKV